MNSTKRILGVIWIAVGCFFAYYITFRLIVPRFSSDKGEDIIVGSIYCLLLPIISLSLILFGYYALMGEYAKEE